MRLIVWRIVAKTVLFYGVHSTMLQNGTSVVPSRIILAAGLNMTLDVVAADPEGDPVTLEVIPYAITPASVSITDYKNGTGRMSIDTSGMMPGTYAFMITAYDGQNLERAIYTVIIP